MTLAAEDANPKPFDVSADVDVVVACSLKRVCCQLYIIILVGLLSNRMLFVLQIVSQTLY